MNKLRMGMVGCGDIAGFTALVSKFVPQVILTACCDTNIDRAQAFAKRHKIAQVFRDYENMLVSSSLDAVYLAVPHHLHFKMLETAIANRLPALVEKPITRTLEEGIKVTSLAGQAGIKLGVNYQYRYDRGCHALARAAQQGALGKIFSVRINVPWRREWAYFENSAWHKTVIQAGGGTLITQGSHFLDIALWALGSRPVSAAGYTAHPGFAVEVETLAHGVVETANGALVSITSTMVAPREQAVTIEMYGERGCAVYRNRPLPHVKFTGVKVRQQRPPGIGVHALQRSLAGFANWVLEDRPFLIPASEALPALAVVETMYQSARSGRRETVHDLTGLSHRPEQS